MGVAAVATVVFEADVVSVAVVVFELAGVVAIGLEWGKEVSVYEPTSLAKVEQMSVVDQTSAGKQSVAVELTG